MKAQKENRGIAPPILDFGVIRRWVARFTLRPLYCREYYPGVHRIGGWMGPEGRFVEEKSLFSLSEFEPWDWPTRSLVAIPTTPSRLPPVTVADILWECFVTSLLNCLVVNMSEELTAPLQKLISTYFNFADISLFLDSYCITYVVERLSLK
jgi:hypothetical protein